MTKEKKYLFNPAASAACALATAALLVSCAEKPEALAKDAAAELKAPSPVFQPAAPVAPAPVDPETVLATVDGVEIKQAELSEVMDQAIRSQLGAQAAQMPPEQIEAFKAQMGAQMAPQILRSLVDQKIVEKAVAASGISISDEDYNKAVAEISARVPAGMTLEQALAKDGMSMDKFKEMMSMQMKTQKYFDSQMKEVEVTDEDAKAFYDENPEKFKVDESATASHILIKIEPTDDDDTKAAKKAKLAELKKKIEDGADFAELAKENSDCPSGKQAGGSLGSFGKKQMVAPFSDAAFSQEIGEVGDIVETQFGYHIIKVDARTEASVKDFDESKEQIKGYLSNLKTNEQGQGIMEKLRTAAKVEYPES